jgi:hypothetical protein
MTTMAIEKQDASTTVASLTASLADAQSRLDAVGPEHEALHRERRAAYKAHQDTESFDVRLERLDRDAVNAAEVVAELSAELAAATAAALQEEIAAARIARAVAELDHCEVGQAVVSRIFEVMRDELAKEAVAYAALYEAHERLNGLEGSTGALFNNAVFGQLGAVVANLADDRGVHDLAIELTAAREKLARLVEAS